MQRDREYLLDICESAKMACSYLSGRTRQQFERDFQCQDAVIRRLEIVGEAARRLSAQTRAALPNIPWNDVIGMRNIMIHEYDSVDLEAVGTQLIGILRR